MSKSLNASQVNFNGDGLVPVVVQSVKSRKVLMLAWMNEQALDETIKKGEAVFYSRSRLELWHKGATSGNIQKVISISVDCDGDAILMQVQEEGPACHTGLDSCFDTQTIFGGAN